MEAEGSRGIIEPIKEEDTIVISHSYLIGTNLIRRK